MLKQPNLAYEQYLSSGVSSHFDVYRKQDQYADIVRSERLGASGAHDRDMDHEMMLTSSAANPSSLPIQEGSSSPNTVKHAAINNNNTDDFHTTGPQYKMKETYGLYGPDNGDPSTDGDADCSSDRLFESNGDYQGDEEEDNEGMLVIKPMDSSEIGISPAQSMLRGASKRKALKPCGGRRKQSKPTRFYMDFDPSEGEAGELPQGAAGGGENGSMRKRDTTFPPLGLDEHVSRMGVDRQDMESARRNDSSSPLAAGDNFPTKYHQLGNQLMLHQEGVLTITPEEPSEDRSASPPGERSLCLEDEADPAERPRFSPTSSQGDTSNHSGEMPGPDGSIKSGSRIFHPDAYCELCNREFCNKYFLKTHKANKHGIYDNSTSPDSHAPPPGHLPMPQLPNGFPNFALHPMEGMPPVSLPASLPMSLPMHVPPSMAQSPPRQTLTSATMASSLATIKKEVSPNQHPPYSPPSHQPHIPLLSLPRLPLLPNPSTPKSSSSSEKNEKSMEDYCEICQKHFCNKYYLKKHKQDVHGIVPTTPTMKRSRPTVMCSSSGGSTSMTANSITSNAQLGIPHSPGPSNGLPGMPNMAAMANVMFINPFTPPMFIHTQPMMPGGPGGFIPNGLPPSLPHLPPTSEPQPHKSSRPPSSSPHSSTSSTNKDQQPLPAEPCPRTPVGAPLNADAYCELCRKEFCNRYFLKIHKANKHGIFIDDESEEGGLHVRPPSSASPDKQHTGPWEASRASPSSDQSKNSIKIESASKGEEMYSCRTCNMDFHSKESYRIHNMNVHGYHKSHEDMKQLDMDMALAAKMAAVSGGVEAGEVLGAQGHLPHLPPPPFALEGLMSKHLGLPHNPPHSDASTFGKTMFGNMIAAKLADRVMCDICNKEVCNKYFLKTHKFKVHGIPPDPPQDQGKERERRQAEDISIPIGMHSPPSDISGPADLSTKSRDASGSGLPQLGVGPPTSGPPPPVSTTASDIKRPNDQELLKMGIDPEAYCEICKKEFCSKYFLKTHKQNIHGIKIENSMPRDKHRDSQRDLSSLQTSFNSLPPHMSPGMVPSMNLAPTMVPAMRPGITNGQPHGPAPPGLMPNLFNFHLMPEHQALADRQSWKWKEPINATRVMCDICNKELCNKYFLRTHMLNKHGLHWDHVTGQTTPAKPQDIPQDGSKRSSASSTPCSTPPIDTKVSSFNPMLPMNMFDIKTSLNNASHVFPDPLLAQHHPFQLHFPQRGGVIVSKDGPHRDMDIGEGKQFVPNTSKSESDLPSPNSDIYNGSVTVTAKTWQVPAVNGQGVSGIRMAPGQQHGPSNSHFGSGDLKAENLVNGTWNESRQTSSSILKCDLCGNIFGDSLNLHLHKVQDHGLQLSKSPMYHNAAQVQDSRYITAMATYSLKKKYQNNMRRKFRASRRWRRLGENVGVIGDKVKSAIVNHVAKQAKKKKYRCAHCQERFSSRVSCQAHIRADHPYAKLNHHTDSSDSRESHKIKLFKRDKTQRSNEGGVKASGDRRLSEVRELPVSYARPAQAAPASPQQADALPPYLMQPFTVQETDSENNNFPTSIVYLPVMQKVSQPLTVTFKLTPTEQ